MSADRDRGIRRIKQKRAKAQKKDERQQRSAGVAKRTAVTPTGASAGLKRRSPAPPGARLCKGLDRKGDRCSTVATCC